MGSQRIGHDLATEQQQMYQLHLNLKKKFLPGNSLEVQWSGLSFTDVAPGLGPGLGNGIPQATWHGQKNKKIPCVYSVKILKNSFFLLFFEDILVSIFTPTTQTSS